MTISYQQNNDLVHTASRYTARQAYGILRVKDVCKLLGCSRSTIYNYINPESEYYRPDFPKSIKLSKRSVGWKADEIFNYIDTLSEEK